MQNNHHHKLFNPGLFNHEFLNHGIEKFMVEKSGVEMSFNILERWHFNSRLLNHELFNPMVQKFMVENFSVEKSGVERSGVEMSFNLFVSLDIVKLEWMWAQWVATGCNRVKVIHPKYYKHLKEPALAQPFGQEKMD